MKRNINTPKFWDIKNKTSKNKLLKSKIYIHKNKIVLNWIPNKSIDLLNVGVGNGFLELNISKLKPAVKLSGIDISPESIFDIKQKVKGFFGRSRVSDLSFKKEVFDIVTALDILE